MTSRAKPRAKPPIDKKNATDLHPNAGAVPPIPEDDDVPLAVSENMQPYLYTPQPGIGAKTQLELVMMFVLQLVTGTPPGKGEFRQLGLRSEYFQALSDQAQQHMKQAPGAAPAPPQEED